MAERRHGTDDTALKAEAIAILLHGWAAEPPSGIDPGEHGFGGGLLDCLDQDGPARLWREHADWFRRVAKAWGWAPSIVGPDGVRRFYAEHYAAGYSE